MRLTLNHPFLYVILIVVSLSISQVIRSAGGSLEITLLYVAYATAWAPLVSLAKDYLDKLDNREKMMNV